MPDIRLCRPYIEHNYPQLLDVFDSLALKVKDSGADPQIFFKHNLRELNLDSKEWEVLTILLCAMGNRSYE